MSIIKNEPLNGLGLTPQSSFTEVVEVRKRFVNSTLAVRSIETYGQVERCLFRFWDKNRPISSFNRKDLAELVEWLRKKEEASRDWTMLVCKFATWVVNWAADQGVIEASPYNRRCMPKIPKPERRRQPFTYGEFQRLLGQLAKYCNTEEYTTYFMACTVSYWTGMRVSDVAMLRWDPDENGEGNFVDFLEEIIVVFPRKKAAYRQRLEIPLEPELYEALQNHLASRRQDVPWVNPMFRWKFLNLDGDIKDKMRRCCDKLGLHNHSFHSFRHGFVSRLVNAGVDPITISSMTGQCLSIIQGYAHVSKAAKTAALAQARRALHAARMEQLDYHSVNRILTV